MRDGLRFSVAMNEYVLSAICVTALALGVGYEATHRTYPAPAPVPCPTVTAAAPTIEIHETIYVPVPAPATVTLPDEFTPDPNLEKPQDDSDPVFEHRTPIITDALRQPMIYAKNQ
jgi:hypothetical protein